MNEWLVFAGVFAEWEYELRCQLVAPVVTVTALLQDEEAAEDLGKDLNQI